MAHLLSSKAFTLIELLIVVAIIAILAAIAVPNFLDAQTRAKVSRARSDFRTLATGLEAYRVDANRYPPHGERLENGTVNFPASAAGIATVEFLNPASLTTPVAYLTSTPRDIFSAPNVEPPLDSYGYIESRLGAEILRGNGLIDSANGIVPTYGGWRIYSGGPDLDKGRDIKLNVLYDPTNGTISNGDLVRSQRDTVLTLAEDE